MIGTIVWVAPRDATNKRPNKQRARLEAVAVGHAIGTYLGDEKVELINLDWIVGIEFDEKNVIQWN